MNICSQGRKLLNFLTFKLIIIQFIICVSFSGFSMLTKVIPTARFHRTTTWTKTMTRNDTTPNSLQQHTHIKQRINKVSHNNVLSSNIPSHAYNNIFNNIPSNVSYQTTYRTTYHTSYQTSYHTTNQTPNNNQPAGLSDDLPKDLSNLSNNMTNRTACKAYNNQPLGATKSSLRKKLNDTVSRGLLFGFVFFSFFCARSVWMYDPSEFSVYRGIV